MTSLIFYDLSIPENVNYRKCEEEIIEGKFDDKPIPYIETCILNADSLLKFFRLILFQSQICNNGIKFDTLQIYRKNIVQSFGIQVLSWFIRLQMAGLIRCLNNKSENIMPTYLFSSPPPIVDLTKKKFKFFSTTTESNENDGHYYNGYIPRLIRILEDDELKDFTNWNYIKESSSAQAADSSSKKNNKKIIEQNKKRLLFVIGGITRAEMGIINERFPNIKFCCTTSIITGNELIQGFRE